MSTTFPAWAGFERPPKGRLLRQVVELDGALGLAYERSVGFSKSAHVHDRHMIVCPRGAAVMQVVAGRTRVRVDGRHLLWVPREVVHADEAVTTLYDTLALYPAANLFELAATAANLAADERARLDSRCVLARRTGFLDELLEQYFAARVVAQTAIDPFQERQLVVAAVRALAGKRDRAGSRTPDEGDDAGTFERSIRYIEANLFLPISLEAIAKSSGASISTVLRAFRRAIRQTPYAYVKARRLDEAKHLLERGQHRVGEVALLVGYEDVGAFSKAFRRRFRCSPREIDRSQR